MLCSDNCSIDRPNSINVVSPCLFFFSVGALQKFPKCQVGRILYGIDMGSTS